jgi:hypothetical protein
MRLPVRKIYRAFPELDPFDDAKCAQFVRVAAGRGRALRLFIQLLVGGVMLVGLGIPAYHGAVRAAESLMSRSDALSLLLPASIVSCSCGLAALAFLAARDFTLRRAVRRVMFGRGACPKCGYGLTGVPVRDSTVMCPECAFEIHAEAACGEIVDDINGVARFLPSPDATPAVYSRFSRAQKILLARVFAALLVLALAAFFGWQQLAAWQVRIASRQAQQEKAGAQAAMQSLLRERAQKAGAAGIQVPRGSDVITMVQWVSASMNEAARGDAGESVTARNVVWITARPPPGADEATVQEFATRRKEALALLDRLRTAGIVAQLDKLAACPRDYEVQPLDLSKPEQLLQSNLASTIWAPLEVNAARMSLATDAKDRSEFLAAFESNLAILGAMEMVPLVADWWQASQLWSRTFAQASSALAGHPDAEWVAGMTAALARQRSSAVFVDALRGEQIVVRARVAAFFADPRRVANRDLAGSGALFATGTAPVGPIGTYPRNISEVDAFFKALIADAAVDPFQRGGPRRMPTPTLAPAVAANYYTTYSQQMQMEVDQRELTRRGLEYMLALESFRLQTGAYPGTLDALVPSHLPALPPDPHSGRPFVYRPTPGVEPGYVLYSIGPDGVDDGGLAAPTASAPGMPATSGIDVVIAGGAPKK